MARRRSSSVCSPSGHVVEHVVLEAALQQVVGERAEQVFHAHFAGRIGNVFAVANAFHRKQSQSSASVVSTRSLRWSLTTDEPTTD